MYLLSYKAQIEFKAFKLISILYNSRDNNDVKVALII